MRSLARYRARDPRFGGTQSARVVLYVLEPGAFTNGGATGYRELTQMA